MRRIIIFTLLISIILLPANFFHPDHFLPDRNDSLLITYIINQVQNNFLHQQNLYYGLYFAPEKNTLTYSDLFLTTALITLPVRYLSSSPLTVYNTALFLDLVLTGLSVYLLIYEFTKDHFSAFIGSLIFNFSGFHFAFLPHLQVFSLWLLPLSLYLLRRFLKTHHSKFLIFFLICLTAQIAESFFTAYLIIFASVIMLIFRFLTSQPQPLSLLRKITQSGLAWSRRFAEQSGRVTGRPDRRIGNVAVSVKRDMARSWLIIPLLPLWYLLAKPYLDLHSQFPEAVRSIRDAAHFSLGLDELFTRYHSLIFFALFLFSLIFLIRRSLPKANDQKSNIIVLIAILISSFLMSLGPVLKIFGQTVKIFGLPIPLPYTLFYYLVPGFNGFRTPSRWLLLAALAAMIISSFSFRKLKSLNQKLILLVVFLLVVLEGRPFHTSYSIDYEPPAVYRQVKDLPKDAVIIELPIKLWSSTDNQIESLRALYSLYHQHRRFNGYSGFNTLAWQSLVSSILADGLDKNNTDRLKKLGVTHIVSENKLFAL